METVYSWHITNIDKSSGSVAECPECSKQANEYLQICRGNINSNYPFYCSKDRFVVYIYLNGYHSLVESKFFKL